MKILAYIAILIAVVLPSVATAHQDTVFSINESGVLEGVPTEYAPISIENVGKTLRINIAKNEIILPNCIIKYFSDIKTAKVEAKGSWYHDTKLLPEYIIFNINAQNHQTKDGYPWFVGHELFFTLRYGELFYFLEYFPPENDSQFRKSINFIQECSADELSRIKHKEININLEGTTTYHRDKSI